MPDIIFFNSTPVHCLLVLCAIVVVYLLVVCLISYCIRSSFIVAPPRVQLHSQSQSPTPTPTPIPNPKHLIIVQHGHCASWLLLVPFSKWLANAGAARTRARTRTGASSFLIHTIRANSNDWLFGFRRTQDGIRKGGRRTANEIKSVLDEYPSIRELSMIGCSLGGLYNRYALKELFVDDHDHDDESDRCHNNNNHLRQNHRTRRSHRSHRSRNKAYERVFYQHVRPINFVTLATPHFGIRRGWRSQHAFLFCLLCKMAARKYLRVLLPTSILELSELDVVDDEDEDGMDSDRDNADNVVAPLMSALEEEEEEDSSILTNDVLVIAKQAHAQNNPMHNTNTMLHSMANREEYLSPLRLFENRLLYGAVNDSKVSIPTALMMSRASVSVGATVNGCSSVHDAAEVKKRRKRQKQKQTQKAADIVAIHNEVHNADDSSFQFHRFARLSQSMQWKKFAVTMNNKSVCVKYFAHDLLTAPMPALFRNDVETVLQHLEQQFKW